MVELNLCTLNQLVSSLDSIYPRFNACQHHIQYYSKRTTQAGNQLFLLSPKIQDFFANFSPYSSLLTSVLPTMKLSLSTVIAVYNLLAAVVISDDAIEDLDKAILDDIIQSYSTHEPSTCNAEEQSSSTSFSFTGPALIPNRAGIPILLAMNKVFSKPSCLTMIPLAKTYLGQSESVPVGTCTASSIQTYLANLSLPKSTSMRHG